MRNEERQLPGVPDECLVYGKNAVLELLKSERPLDVLYLEPGVDAKTEAYFAALARAKGAAVKQVPAAKLSALSGGGRHQGFVASASGIDYCGIDDLLSAARERREDPLIVIADGIEDPHNLGAIIRTAEAVGAHGLVIARRGSAFVGSAVQRSSAGAVNHISVARVSNLAAAVRELKQCGVFCYCADMEGRCVYGADLTGPAALVVGSEGKGVSRLLRDLCDGAIALPMRGKTASLNASVAAGALLYEMVRQRMTVRTTEVTDL